MTAKRVATTLTFLLLLCRASAQTSYPMITHTTPVAVQRGTTAEVTVEGQQNFQGTYKVLLHGAGLTAEVVATPPPTTPAKAPKGQPAAPAVRSVKLKITVAPDAPLGPREFRLVTPLGVSSIGQLVVVEEPVIPEKGDNNTPEKANPITLPGVVCGRIEAIEDVDYFKFQAEAGQHLTFEVFCARLQDKIHDLQKHADPLLALFDAEGRELAGNDDSYFADALLRCTVVKSGAYVLQVRDSKYDGDARWVYAVLATNRPYASHVFPMAGNPGRAVQVEPVGSARAIRSTVAVQVPPEAGLHEIPLDVGGPKTYPVAFLASPLPQVLEQEPNNDPKSATRVTLPCGINGRVGAPRDLDHFIFTAKKSQAIRFEVKARRFGTPLRSSLDSVVDVLNLTGQVLANNDDTFGKDAAVTFTPPADGDYVLRLRDLNSKGGETAVYFIEADFARPEFTLRTDPDKAMIGPGSSTAWYVHVTRANGFTGPVAVSVAGLPQGVTVNPLTIPPEMTQGLLVLTAAADAPRDAANVRVIGTAAVNDQQLACVATPNQEIYFPGGGRGRFDVAMQTVAVTEPSDILKVEVTPNVVTLKPGQEVRLDVTIQRRKDYDKPVTLDVMLRHLNTVYGNPLPPGVTLLENKSKTLLGTASKGHIVLRADPKAAPIKNVPVSVLAHVSINFVVKVSYSSAPIPVTVQQ